jgi:hypothetical protein
MSYLNISMLLASAALGILFAHATSLQGWSQVKPPTLLLEATAAPATDVHLLQSERKSSIVTSEWTMAPPPPLSLMEHSLVSLGCDSASSYPTGTTPSIVLIGGSNASGSTIASVYSFDINLHQWLVLNPMPEPRQAAMAVLSQSRGGIVVCGGRC